MTQLERVAPGISARVSAAELLTPTDLEAEFGMCGGHWHHGEISVDQLLMLRPVPLAAQYAMPVEGLWLCGAGTHPGGGIMGLAGRNCAREILRRRSGA
jgi:phytoene dehydrogenase-like protein